MFWDIAIALGVGATQVIITIYAVVLTLHKKRGRAAFVIGLVGGIGIALTVAATIRNTNGQGELKDQVRDLKGQISSMQIEAERKTDADIAIASVVSVPPTLSLGTNLFHIVFQVTGNTARNVRPYDEVFAVTGKFDQVQAKKVNSEFQVRALPHLNHEGTTLKTGSTIQDIQGVTLSERELEELSCFPEPTRTIYFLTLIKWNNPSGSSGELSVCRILQPPILQELGGGSQNGRVGWGNCFR
jgi:hypothetical protein